MRLGALWQERPAVLLDGKRAVDVSADLDDFGSSFFAAEGLDHVHELVATRHQIDVVGNHFDLGPTRVRARLSGRTGASTVNAGNVPNCALTAQDKWI
jgi:hypothetical protein